MCNSCGWIITCAIISLTLVVFQIALLKAYSKIKHLKWCLNSKHIETETFFIKIEKLSKDRSSLKERVIELENAIEKGYGVKIRNEITEVIADFNKLEMVIIYSGISKLLEGKTTPDDAQIYIDLCKKIQGFIDKMKEDEQRAFNPKGK